MSGLFKNFDRFVGPATLSAPHKLLLRVNLNSANLYYDPSHRYTGLPSGHSFGVFQLASISSALAYEAKQFLELQTEIATAQAELNLRLSAQCAREAVSLIANKAWNQEADALANLLYAIKNNHTETIEIQPILDQIISNAQWFSTQNIVDIVVSLKDYENEAFWSQFFAAIKDKEFAWNYQIVEPHGWTINQFEYSHGEQKPQKLTHTQAQLQYYQSKNEIKKFLYDAILFAWTGIYIPIFNREKRISYLFDERPIDRDAFRKELQRRGAEELLRRA